MKHVFAYAASCLRAASSRGKALAFRSLLASALVLLASVSAPELHAQSAPPGAATSPELRLIPHALGRATLSAPDGTEYGNVGWFGSDLTMLEQHSASAAERVRVFKRQRTIGSLLLAAGAAVAAGSLYQYVSDNHFGASDRVSAGYIGGGAVAMVGLVQLSIGQQSLRAALNLSNQR